MGLPILVTGILIRNRQRQLTAQGFTLWEMLIVVIIISTTVSVILLSIDPSRGSSDLKLLGKDMGKLLRLLSQEAVFENRNFAISLKHKGYKVVEYNGEEWDESNQSLFRKIRLNEAQRSRLVVGDLEVKTVDDDEMVPHILILSSGEITPFEWTINDENAKASIHIQGDLLGNIQITGPVPDS